MYESVQRVAEAMWSTYPELETVRHRAEGLGPVYLVGGAVRDLLLGHGRADLDLVIVGDAAALAAALEAKMTTHERFATAKVELEGHEVDIATARAESYPQPGALPEVVPAEGIEADLGRRDFTINAMAIPLEGDGPLIDPHGGVDDLESALLRVLHSRSFADDPTRALRAARYASRFGFHLEPETEALLKETDIATISEDRRKAELLRLAGEARGPQGFALLAEWNLFEPRQGGVELAEKVAELLAKPPWEEVAERGPAILAAALGPPGEEVQLAATHPGRPSEGVEVAGGHDPIELLLGRALGAEWLDRYLMEWRDVELEIDGQDLKAAGVPEGPAMGRGLAAALRAKLDGEITGRDEEMKTALRAVGGGDGVA